MILYNIDAKAVIILSYNQSKVMKIEEEMIDELFRHHHFLFQLKDYI